MSDIDRAAEQARDRDVDDSAVMAPEEPVQYTTESLSMDAGDLLLPEGEALMQVYKDLGHCLSLEHFLRVAAGNYPASMNSLMYHKLCIADAIIAAAKAANLTEKVIIEALKEG